MIEYTPHTIGCACIESYKNKNTFLFFEIFYFIYKTEINTSFDDSLLWNRLWLRFLLRKVNNFEFNFFFVFRMKQTRGNIHASYVTTIGSDCSKFFLNGFIPTHNAFEWRIFSSFFFHSPKATIIAINIMFNINYVNVHTFRWPRTAKKK